MEMITEEIAVEQIPMVSQEQPSLTDEGQQPVVTTNHPESLPQEIEVEVNRLPLTSEDLIQTNLMNTMPVHSQDVSQSTNPEPDDSMSQQRELLNSQTQEQPPPSLLDPTSSSSSVTLKKKRGPKPRPRDEFGNIIKTTDTTTTTATKTTMMATTTAAMSTSQQFIGKDSPGERITETGTMMTRGGFRLKNPPDEKMGNVEKGDFDGKNHINHNGSTTAAATIDNSQQDMDSEVEGDIRCICDFTDDDGFTIQCEQCLVWQHMDCVGVDDDNVPEAYFCERCRPRPVDAETANRIQRKKRLRKMRRRTTAQAKHNINSNPMSGDSGGLLMTSTASTTRSTDVHMRSSQRELVDPQAIGDYEYDEDNDENSAGGQRRMHDIHIDSNSEDSSGELGLIRKGNELRPPLKRRGRPPSISISSTPSIDSANDNGRKLSREERKLQQLMETFHRIEDREKKKAKRHHHDIDSTRPSLLKNEYSSHRNQFSQDKSHEPSSDESLSEGPMAPSTQSSRRFSSSPRMAPTSSGGTGSSTLRNSKTNPTTFSRRHSRLPQSLYALKGKKAWLVPMSSLPSKAVIGSNINDNNNDNDLSSSREMSNEGNPILFLKLEVTKPTSQSFPNGIDRQQLSSDRVIADVTNTTNVTMDFPRNQVSHEQRQQPEVPDSTTNIDVVGGGLDSPSEELSAVELTSIENPSSFQQRVVELFPAKELSASSSSLLHTDELDSSIPTTHMDLSNEVDSTTRASRELLDKHHHQSTPIIAGTAATETSDSLVTTLSNPNEQTVPLPLSREDRLELTTPLTKRVSLSDYRKKKQTVSLSDNDTSPVPSQ